MVKQVFLGFSPLVAPFHFGRVVFHFGGGVGDE